MSMRVVAAILVSAVLALGAASGSSPYQNDAGSGRDAPNVESLALLLPGDGSYAGHLLARGDTDWYTRTGASDLACTAATFSSASAADAALVSIGADGSRRVLTGAVPAGGSLTLATIGRDTARWSAVAENLVSSEDHRAYGLGWRTITAGGIVGDAGTADDAPSSGGWAIAPGCIGGTIGGADVRDEYTFTALAGTEALLSLAQTGSGGVSLTLLSPAGDILRTIVAGETALVQLPEDGVYTLSASSLSTGSALYMAALVLGPDPPGSGCKPTC